jgi:superfamily II DNA or RNA helicase
MSYFEQYYDSVRYPGPTNNGNGLRRAQHGAIHAIAMHFTLRSEPAIAVMPTGSGKTAVAMLAPFVLRANRVLVVTPSRLVRNQIAEDYKTLRVLKISGALGEKIPAPRVYEAESRVDTEARWEELRAYDVVVGTPNSTSPAYEGVARPPTDLFDLIVVDEAHHSSAATWNALLQSFPEAKRVLFTATPFRRDRGEILGRIVYNFPVSEAYRDKIFGKIEYIPVKEGGADNDRAIAKRAEQVFNDDRAKGFDHFLMVRTDTRKRADALKQVYAKHTRLNLQLIHSGLSYGTIKAAVKKLRDKRLDGVICVNMLGEGFDLPNLKIAAIHAPHKSLAVTLQFIGRFARTNDQKVGTAKFIAVPSEIRGEVEQLYHEGAVWQDIVTNLSRGRIEEEVVAREIIESFAPPTDFKLETADLSLYALRPFNHVRVYEVDSKTDTQREIELPSSYSLVFRQPNPEQSTVVFITEEKTRPRWTNLDLFMRTEYHLFIAYFDRASSLLFIHGSCKNDALYEQLAQLFSNDKPQCLPLHKINKVLLELEDFEFFNIGMSSRVSKSNVESYRIIAGSSAQKAISRSDARKYHQGHIFGRARQGSRDVTIGYSKSSKAWSNTNTQIPQLIAWCRELATRIMSHKQVETHSGLDALPVGEAITQIPDGVLAAEWDRDAFDRPMTISYKRADGSQITAQLLDYELKIDRKNSGKGAIRFGVCNDEAEWWHNFSLNSGYTIAPVDREASGNVIVMRGRYPETLVDYLNGNPPCFYFSDLSKLQGAELFRSQGDGLAPFDVNQIEVMNWATAGVDIEQEYGVLPSGKLSIQEFLKEYLKKSNSQVVFYDHGSGEIADFVTFHLSRDEIVVSLYHCKAAGGRAPGARVDDVYEVCGQTVKSLIWVNAQKLFERISYRNQRRADSYFLKGSKTELRSIVAKAKSMPTRFEIVVVQPGISRAMLPERMANVLAASDDYIRSHCEALRVLASE